MIQLDGIGKQYGGTRVPTPVLKGVSLTIAAGERVALTGASGSGKTTLMNIMGLLDAPSAGRLRLDGRETHFFTAREAAEARNRLIGFVFQSFHLMPHLSALDNVALPLLYRGIAKTLRREIAAETLDQVGLGQVLHRRPAELSGGQRQRVAVARAMVGCPKILLAVVVLPVATAGPQAVTADVALGKVKPLDPGAHGAVEGVRPMIRVQWPLFEQEHRDGFISLEEPCTGWRPAAVKAVLHRTLETG